MEKPRLSQKLKYAFDNLMSRGTGALLGTLAVVTLIVILLASFFIFITNASPENGFLQLVWMSFNRALDSGTMGGDSGSFLYFFFMFLVTVAGIFILSMLIGLLNTAIESKLEALRKGRSKVIEKGHTVILGWSEHIFTIIGELIEANSNQKNCCIVIMGDRDKMEMDDAIKERISDLKTTRIVTRQGNPIDIDDLEIVGLNTSKSIIILEGNDSNVIKTILAITNNPRKRKEPYHIVATLKNLSNLDVARIAGNDQAEIIITDNLIARIMAQTCRQPGLSTVYTELLDFGGDEIYFKDCPELYGKTFGESLFRFEKSTVIGINSGDRTFVNPPMDTVIQKGDKIIAISEDDDTVIVSASPYATDKGAISSDSPRSAPKVEKTLLLGWNGLAGDIVRELDNYVCSGSMLTIVSPHLEEESYKKALDGITNQTVDLVRESTEDRKVLDSLTAKLYDHIIILCDNNKNLQEADSSTLITLLHLRDIAEKTGIRFSIVSEIMDFRNKKLAEVTKVNDFIVSEKLISLIMSQVSENRLLNAVFADLFDADGSEIYVRPAGDYVTPGKAVNFYTVLESATRRNEVAIGYISASQQDDPDSEYGIHVNPLKTEKVTFSQNDSIIVIAED